MLEEDRKLAIPSMRQIHPTKKGCIKKKRTRKLVTANKVPFIVIIPLLIYAFASHRIVTSRFKDQETSERLRDMRICKSMLNDNYRSLQMYLQDYSMCDEAWNAVKNPNKQLLDETFTGWFTKHSGIDAVILTDTKLQVIASAGLKEDFRNIISRQPAIIQALSGKKSAGLIRNGNSIYIIATAPVLRCTGKGPCAGTLTMARLFDNEIISGVAKMADLELALFVDGNIVAKSRGIDDSLFPRKTSPSVLESVRNGGFEIQIEKAGNRAYVWHGLQDWNGNPIATLVTSTSRNKTTEVLRRITIRSIVLVFCCLTVLLLATMQVRVSVLAQRAHIDELTVVYNHRFLQ